MRLMRLMRAAAIGLLLSIAVSACVPGAVQHSPAELAAAQRAASLARQGQFEQAAQAYLALADQSAHGDAWRLAAAEARWQEGQLERAAPSLAKVDRARLINDEPLRLDLLRAELALDHHDAATALQLTSPPPGHVPAALQLRLLELRARAMAENGDDWGAARTRAQMDPQLSGLDQSQNRRLIVTLLSKLGIPALQQRAAAMGAADRMLPWINEALNQLGVSVARSQPVLQQPVGTLLPGPDANVREGYKIPAQIALLLPSDGEYGAASTSIREGFFAGYFQAGQNHAPRPKVTVYDSRGTAEGAVAAYQRAVHDGAQLIVGPLARGEVAAVFAQAQLPVPVLALNHPDDRQLPAGGTTEFGLLPETEGALAADHMIERGLRHAWILISGDDFAQRAAGAFKAELAARGGRLEGMNVIANFNAAMAGVDTHAMAAAQSVEAGEPGPASSAATPSATTAASPVATAPAQDAGIFISMRPHQARLLIPQLRVANVHLPLIATSHVYTGRDNATSDRDLDGLEFCDAPWLFDAQPGLPNHGNIEGLLPAAGGSGARLFAFGMDAWDLAPYLDWLRAHPGSYLPGASGQLAADPFGRIRRVLIWAKFQDGIARPLSGSLQMDDVPAFAPPEVPAPAPASSAPNTGNPPTRD